MYLLIVVYKFGLRAIMALEGGVGVLLPVNIIHTVGLVVVPVTVYIMY